MAMTMHVDVVSSEREIYSGAVEEVYAPAEMGEVGILPRHAPMVTRLKAGEVRVKPEGEQEMESIFVSGGILEVQPHVVTVLADTGMRAADIDEAAAKEAKQRAEEAMKDLDSDMEYAQVKAELLAAAKQLELLQKLRKKGR